MRKLRVLALMAMFVVSLLLMLPYFVEGLHWTVIEIGAFYLFGILALMSFLYTGPSMERDRVETKQVEISEGKTVTAIACYGCKHTEEREFKKGDYIGKVLGKCPKCKGQRYIRAIYAVAEKDEKL